MRNTRTNTNETGTKENEMNATYRTLEAMTVGCTKVINGHAVTRWSQNAFEIGTWGRAYFDIHKAAERLTS